MAITKIQNGIGFTQTTPPDKQQRPVAMERLVPLPKNHYRNCYDIPETVNMIRPEKGQGHLIGNNPFYAIGRFFANRYYDLKSVYKGYTGTANDHQLGRTNDVGLILGGLGIASFLATKRLTDLPKHMEFIGLGSFLTSMALWPKIGVFGPARLVHGFDVDKRYIDDQGRNKSVFQDPNYVPFDLYDGRRKSENLSAIGDHMGIAKGVANRDDMVKDQMRKIATQNNTLWMLSSGFAVPTMTALLSNVVERAYEPHLIANKASKYKNGLQELFNSILSNTVNLDKKFDITKNFKDFVKDTDNMKIATQSEIDNFVSSVTRHAGDGIAAALSQDITKMAENNNNKRVVVDNEFLTKFSTNLKEVFGNHPQLRNVAMSPEDLKNVLPNNLKSELQRKGSVAINNGYDLVEGVIVEGLKRAQLPPQSTEIENTFRRQVSAYVRRFFDNAIVVDNQYVKDLAINLESKLQGHRHLKSAILSLDEIKQLLPSGNLAKGVVIGENELINKIIAKTEQKIQATASANIQNRLIEIFKTNVDVSTLLPKVKDPKVILSSDNLKAIEALANPLEKYIATFKQAKELNNLQMGEVQDSYNAFNWAKLQQAFIDVTLPKTSLNQYKKLIDNSNDTKLAIKTNLETLVSNPEEYAKAIKKINDLKIKYLKEVLGDMPVEQLENKYIDLVLGENPSGGYCINKRTAAWGGTEIDKFIEIQTRMAEEFSSSLNTGALKNNFTKLSGKVGYGDFTTSVAYHEARGKVSKMEEFVTACDKIIHTLDVYKRAHDYKMNGFDESLLGGKAKSIKKAWVEELFEKAKIETLAANQNDSFLRLGFKDKPRMYQAYMQLIYSTAEANAADAPKTLGYLSPATLKALQDGSGKTTQHWINKYRCILGDARNNESWKFIGMNAASSSSFDAMVKTQKAKYRLEGKNLIELAKQGINKSYNSGKWMKMFGSLFATVFSVSVLMQFFFGQKDNTIPTEKAVLRAQRIAERNRRMEAARAN